jgi:hypothetical protein
MLEELARLLDEAGLVLTFDRFRDNTKGCGPHCKAWERGPRTEWCPNHKAAIERGEYTPREKTEEDDGNSKG